MNELSNEQVIERCKEIVYDMVENEKDNKEIQLQNILELLKNHENNIFEKIKDEKKIISYEIAHEVGRIRNLIKEGWIPYGSPLTLRGTIYQALIKYEESQTEGKKE